jgi:hypothetical protein
MPPQLLAWIALGCFFAAGAIGAALLFSHWRRLRVPLAGAFPHGFFAGAGLICLLVAIIMNWGEQDRLGPWPVIALVLLLAAAGGGVALFYLHARAGAIPLWLGAAHASAAVLGVIILFLAMAGQSWTSEPVPLNPVDVDTPANPPPGQAAPAEPPPPPPAGATGPSPALPMPIMPQPTPAAPPARG